MKKFINFISAFSFIIILASCGGGGGGGAPTTNFTFLNNADGASGISISDSFKYTFAQTINTSTVTTSTLFLVRTPSANISPLKAVFNPTTCNVDNAISASVSCSSFLECAIDPSDDLDPGTSYTGCVSPNIELASGETFEGFMATFTTEGSAPVTCTVNDDFSVDSRDCWKIAGGQTWTTWDQISGDILTFDTAAGKLLYTPTSIDSAIVGIYKSVQVDGSGSLVMKVHFIDANTNIAKDSRGLDGIGIFKNISDISDFSQTIFAFGIGDASDANSCAGFYFIEGSPDVTIWGDPDCATENEFYVRVTLDSSSFSIEWSTDDVDENYTALPSLQTGSGVPANLADLVSNFGELNFSIFAFDPGLGSISFDSVEATGFELMSD